MKTVSTWRENIAFVVVVLIALQSCEHELFCLPSSALKKINLAHNIIKMLFLDLPWMFVLETREAEGYCLWPCARCTFSTVREEITLSLARTAVLLLRQLRKLVVHVGHGANVMVRNLPCLWLYECPGDGAKSFEQCTFQFISRYLKMLNILD